MSTRCWYKMQFVVPWLQACVCGHSFEQTALTLQRVARSHRKPRTDVGGGEASNACAPSRVRDSHPHAELSTLRAP